MTTAKMLGDDPICVATNLPGLAPSRLAEPEQAEGRAFYSSARPELARSPVCLDHACMISSLVRAWPFGAAANTDTKLFIYQLFQEGRVLAQDGDDL